MASSSRCSRAGCRLNASIAATIKAPATFQLQSRVDRRAWLTTGNVWLSPQQSLQEEAVMLTWSSDKSFPVAHVLNLLPVVLEPSIVDRTFSFAAANCRRCRLLAEGLQSQQVGFKNDSKSASRTKTTAILRKDEDIRHQHAEKRPWRRLKSSHRAGPRHQRDRL